MQQTFIFSTVRNTYDTKLLRYKHTFCYFHHTLMIQRSRTLIICDLQWLSKKCRCTIDQELTDAAAQCTIFTYLMEAQHFSILHEMTSWVPSWKYDIKSKIQLHQFMHLYVNSKFYPDFNQRNLRLFWRGCPNKKNKMSRDMRSVPDLKTCHWANTVKWAARITKHLNRHPIMSTWVSKLTKQLLVHH